MPRDDHIDKPYLPNRKDFHLEKGTVMKSLMKKVFAAAAAIATGIWIGCDDSRHGQRSG